MSSPRLAFFGATGGCAGYCLAHSLKAGYDCIALARTPAKLSKAMKEKGVSDNTLDQHLTIVSGNVKDAESVKSALQLHGRVVDTIVCGIGGTPTLQWSIMQPVTLTDVTICQDAGQTILEALTQLKPEPKAVLINVSTTGIWPEGMPRDIPIPYIPFYRWMLHVPHEDKEILEARLKEHVRLPEAQRGLQAYVNVKPSLLMDGEGLGLDKVRQGIDEKPAIGYTIQRGDVGLFMFERLVKSGIPQAWRNKSLSLTH